VSYRQRALKIRKPMEEIVYTMSDGDSSSLSTSSYIELKGGEVAKEHGRTLESVYEVKEALDLENETTAYNYVKRSVVCKMKG
jgi:hypothetical protein